MIINKEEAKQLLIKSQQDPIWWVNNILRDSPWSAQNEILKSIRDNRRTVVRSCHAAGKSFLAARAALWFLSNFPYSVVVTTAPTYRQVQKIIWQEMRKAYFKVNEALGGTMLNTTNDPDSFQGIHADHILLIFDEASGVSKEIWDAADSVLSTGHTRFFAIGNPTQVSNSFYNECKAAGTKKFKISAFDTPNFTTFGITIDDIINNTWRNKVAGDYPTPYLINPEWVYERYLRWGKDSPMFRSRILAEFPLTGVDTLIQLHWVEAAQHRVLVDNAETPHELGVDVARFGGDKTVIAERKGMYFKIIEKYSKKDTMETAGLVIKALEDTKATLAKIDSIGVGAGVLDRLKELKKPAREANVAKAPKDKERFLNARAEWYWNLREDFENNKISICDDEDLMAQLSSIKFKVDSKGRIIIESKEDMKKRGMQSPNEADAVMLARSTIPTIQYEYQSATTKQEKLQRIRSNNFTAIKSKSGSLL